MTDGPRFSTPPPNHDDAHLRYFGGGLVNFVFSLADMWQPGTVPRRRAQVVSPYPSPIGSIATEAAPSATTT
jgi:hypothetical protein